MAVLNLADDVKLGAAQVDAVYLGTDLIWPTGGGPPPGPSFPFAIPTDPAVANTAEKWLP